MTNKLIKIFLAFFAVLSFAQQSDEKIITGTVSYISSQNIYVKFESTEGIEIGDTLFFQNNSNIIPAIVVEYKSSGSCAGVSLTNIKIAMNF